MTMRDHLIDSLRRLCDRPGGYKAIADAIGVDDQSLYQIVSGVKLPSGNPKGVGPRIEKLLSEKFPGWADAAPSEPAAPSTSGNAAHETTAPAYNAWPLHTVTKAEIVSLPAAALAQLERIIRAFLGGPVPSDDWRGVALHLAAGLDQKHHVDWFTTFVRGVEEELARPPKAVRPPTPSKAPK